MALEITCVQKELKKDEKHPTHYKHTIHLRFVESLDYIWTTSTEHTKHIQFTVKTAFFVAASTRKVQNFNV